MAKQTRLSGEERRRAILEAALDEFAAHGFSGTRTRAIAERAGVSETLVFQHFTSKEELYGAALAALFGGHPVGPDVEEAAARGEDEAVFGGVARHVLEHTGRDQRIIRLALFSALEGRSFSSGQRPGHRHPGPVDVLEEYIGRREAQGAFRAAAPRLTALLFVEALYMHAADRQVAITSGSVGEVDEDAAIDCLVGLFVRGLGS